MAFEAEYGLLGPERGDWQAAIVAYMVAAAHAGKKQQQMKLSDFLLPWRKRRPQTPQEQLALLRALASRGRQ